VPNGWGRWLLNIVLLSMWTTLRQDLSPVIAVASTLLIGLSLLVMVIAAALRRRTEVNA